MGIDGQDSVSRRFTPSLVCNVFHRSNEKGDERKLLIWVCLTWGPLYFPGGGYTASCRGDGFSIAPGTRRLTLGSAVYNDMERA